MKRITLVLVILLNTFLPTLTFASESISPIITPEIIADVKTGTKVDVDETINTDLIKGSDDRFVVFVKEKKYEEEKKVIADLGGVYSFEDDNTYGKVKALPVDLSYMNNDEKEQFILNMNERSSVVAISKSEKRELSSVPSFNDPYYTSNKLWYLDQPTGSNFGIDALRAWQNLDTEGKSYGGDSSMVVAVIDTGAAYETYGKYADFEEMTSPDDWDFTKASDFTSNLYVNSGETANNQIDDDTNNDPDFCLDRNEDGDCDTGELASFIDDRNGVNIVDWGKYWSRVTYSELTAAPVCSNEPYQTQGMRCVTDTVLDSVCDMAGQTNDTYQGCYESDMGHPNDSNGHGTLVSNFIAASPNNNDAGLGVASGVKILPIKIFGEYYHSSEWVYDSGYGDQIASAINYAVDAGAKIVNMSFAGSSIDLYEKMAMDRAFYTNGVLLIASSGNSASSSAMYPAAYDSVLSVGASTKTGGRASYSTYGSTLDLVAPVDTGITTQGLDNALVAACVGSGNLGKTCLQGDPEAEGASSPFKAMEERFVAGTSFAAPQVVGVAALIMTKYPNLTASDVMYILKMSSLPNGSAASTSSLGHGITNAYNAVRAKDYRGIDLDTIRRMYQSHISTNGYIYTRYSDTFGAKWSNWIQSGSTQAKVNARTLVVPTDSDRVVQIMQGTNSNIYARYADSYGYLAQDDSQWSAWSSLGASLSSPSTTIAGNNIVVSWKGPDGKIYTKYSTNGSTWIGAATSSKVPTGNIVSVYDTTHTKLLQVIRSTGDYLYTRTSADQGQTWGAWIQSYDVAIADPSLAYIDSRIIRVVRIKDNVIVTRYSDNGGITWSSRNRANGSTGLAAGNVGINEVSTSNVILQTYRISSGDIYTRYSANNGTTWNSQIIGIDFKNNVKAIANPTTVVEGDYVVQMVKGSDGYMYYRRSTNAGASWGGWRNSGSIKIYGNIALSFEYEMDRIYVNVENADGKIYSRYSEDAGGTYSAWVAGNATNSSVVSFSTQTKALDLSTD